MVAKIFHIDLLEKRLAFTVHMPNIGLGWFLFIFKSVFLTLYQEVPPACLPTEEEVMTLVLEGSDLIFSKGVAPDSWVVPMLAYLRGLEV